MSMSILLGRIIYYSTKYFEQIISENEMPNADQNATMFDAAANNLGSWFNFTNRQNVILYSALLALMIFVNVFWSHPYFMTTYRYGMNVRVAVTRLVYEKALRVSNNCVQRFTIGTLVNLISNDANRFDMAYIYTGYIHTSMIILTVSMLLIYQYIGR